MYRLGLFVVLLASTTGYPANTWPASQFHVQDQTGSYRYGYSSPHHAKVETRKNGVTKGDYSYIDANGILQTVSYTADDLNGFQIRASNLPRPIENSLIPQGRITTVPEIRLPGERQKHEPEHERFENIIGDDRVRTASGNRENPFLLSSSEAANVQVARSYSSPNAKDSSLSILNYPMGNLPSTTGGGTYIPIVPWKLTHSALHHTQDSLGQYDYSYAGDTSAKTESRSLDGTTRGAYSYIDANGLLQQVHYIADHNGFRVLATNLPEAK